MFFKTLHNHLVDYKKIIFDDYYIDNMIDQIVEINIVND